MRDEMELIEALRTLARPVDPSDEEQSVIWQAVAREMMEDRAEDEAHPDGPSHPVPGGVTLGKGLLRVGAAAVVAVAIALGALWLGGGEAGQLDGRGEDQPGSVGVELPDSHPAADLLARGADHISAFAEMAREEDLAFQCVSGGANQLCVVYADGLMAVVPLATGPGFTATVFGRAVGPAVTVPLDEGPIAIPASGGRFTVVIRDATGTEVASTGGALFDPGSPVGAQQIAVPVISGARGEASFTVGAADSGLLCAEAGGATDAMASCGRGDRLTVVALQQGEQLIVAGYAPAPVGSVTAVLDDSERWPLPLTPAPGGEVVAFGLIQRGNAEVLAVEVRDAAGELVQTHFPSVGPVGEENR